MEQGQGFEGAFSSPGLDRKTKTLVEPEQQVRFFVPPFGPRCGMQGLDNLTSEGRELLHQGDETSLCNARTMLAFDARATASAVRLTPWRPHHPLNRSPSIMAVMDR